MRVLCEGVAAVVGIREGLCLLGGGCESVVREDAICLIGEKTRCVVFVDDAGPGEDQGRAVDRKDGDFLVRPVVEIGGCGVAPMLVAGYCGVGVVLIVEVVKSIGVQEHAIWIVHEAFRWREVDLWSEGAIVACGDGDICWYAGLDVGSSGILGLGSHSKADTEDQRE